MFAVCKWLDELDEKANSYKKRDSRHSVHLATETLPPAGDAIGDSRKRSRSPFHSANENVDGNTYEKPTVYYDRDNRSRTGDTQAIGVLSLETDHGAGAEMVEEEARIGEGCQQFVIIPKESSIRI